MSTISLITSTKNAAGTLRNCLASVAAQTGVGLDHHIVDGESTDGTPRVLRAWAGHPLTISRGPDRGLYDAMNKGVARAGGDIIGILNADDYFADTEVLTRVRMAFEDPEVEACYGDLIYVRVGNPSREGETPVEPLLQCPKPEGRNPKGQMGSTECRPPGGGASSHDARTATPLTLPGEAITRVWRAGPPGDFRWGWMPPHPTFFVRRRVYERIGGFRLDLGSAADYEFMLRALVKHRMRAAYVPGVMVKMRVGGVSNASLRNRWRANRMDRRAWEVNGLRPYPWTLWLKPLRKVGQWVSWKKLKR